MYYPFRKQINKTLLIHEIKDSKKMFFEFFKQVFIIFFKIFLIFVLVSISIFVFNQIKLLIYVKKYYNNDEIINSMSNVLNDFDHIIYSLENIKNSFEPLFGISDIPIIGGVFDELINLLFNVIFLIIKWLLIQILDSLQDGFADALDLLNQPIEPITTEVLNNYKEAQQIFYMLSFKLDVIVTIADAVPMFDFGMGLSDLSNQIWNIGNMVGDKYENVLLPMVETAENMWNSIVMPFTSIFNISLYLIATLTGLTLFVPILTQNQDTLFSLPIYFWLSFMVSIIFIVGILTFQLVVVSGTSNQKKKQKLGKNIIGGIFMTIFSFIFIPILFLSLIFVSAIIIENIFGLSGMYEVSENNSFSKLFVGNSFINGATLFPSGISGNWEIPSYPTGYYEGQTIIVTSTYFDYTFFITFSSIAIIFLFVIMFWLVIKIFNVVQFMILGPITTSFFVKDGGSSFKSWISELLTLFLQLTIMSIQIAILISISRVLSIVLNESVSINPKISIVLVTILIAAMSISMFVFFTKLKNIVFKDRTVKASMSPDDFEGTKVDANVLNKSLEVNSKNISATIKNASKREEKILSKSLDLSQRTSKINDELFKEVKTMKNVQKVNSEFYKELNKNNMEKR